MKQAEHDDWCRQMGLPTWVERNDGFQHIDNMGRTIQVRFSRFHGAMVTVDGHTAYLGDAEPLIAYLKERA